MMAALVSAEEAELVEAAGELSDDEEEEKKDILTVYVRCVPV